MLGHGVEQQLEEAMTASMDDDFFGQQLTFDDTTTTTGMSSEQGNPWTFSSLFQSSGLEEQMSYSELYDILLQTFHSMIRATRPQ